MICFAVLIILMRMKTKEKFDELCRHLLEIDMYVLRSVAFPELCHEHGADVREMDNMFYSVFGVSGEDVLLQLSRGGLTLPL